MRTAMSLVLAGVALAWPMMPSLACGKEPLARRILKETEDDQTAFMKSFLDQGAPAEMGDALTMLVLNKSALVLPLMEQKVEQVLKSASPAECFSDKSVDPQSFVNMIVAMITYAGNGQALQMARRLIKIDENRFGRLVSDTLIQSAAWRNPFGLAYSGLEIGDPAMDKRIAAWGESQLTHKAGTTAAQMKRWWAEAMVDKYGGAPTERQWAEDPIAARLSAPPAESVHNEMLRLAVELLEKRSRK
jgi:hypothetical protein